MRKTIKKEEMLQFIDLRIQENQASFERQQYRIGFKRAYNILLNNEEQILGVLNMMFSYDVIDADEWEKLYDKMRVSFHIN